jgi:hypothetical protein
MTTAGLDVSIKTEISRQDQTAIIAMNRHQCSIHGIRLAYKAGGYLAGTVLARNSVTGYHQAYANGGASGTGTAVGVLLNNVTPASGGTEAAQMLGTGFVYKDKLIGLDSGAETNLQARTIIGADGIAVLSF